MDVLTRLGRTARDWLRDARITWQNQSAAQRLARSARAGLALAALAVVISVVAGSARRVNQALRPVPPAPSALSAQETPSPDPSPTPGAGLGTSLEFRPRDCSHVGPPPVLHTNTFPRIVIPAVGINLDIREGNGGTPPEGAWVAWFYPGLDQPGKAGNTYVYAHAHGNPVGSATGLFWPLHYVSQCDAIYLYTAPDVAYRYMTTVVDLYHSGYDTSVLSQTADERITLQTCNDWSPHGRKTIIVARRYTDPHPTPSPVPAGGALPTRTAPPPGQDPGTPQPTPTPTSGGGTVRRLLPSPGPP